MKILVAAISSATSPDGVGRHAVNLVRCLLQSSEVERVDLVVGDWQRQYFISLLSSVDPHVQASKLRVRRAYCGRSSLFRNLWLYRGLPRMAKVLGSDLVHLAYPVPVDHSRIACPVIVTLHDLYPYDLPENFGYPRVLLNRLILRQCLAASDRIACVSRTTLTRLDMLLSQHAEKASCVYNCVEVQTQISATGVEEITQADFILAVAQHRKSKNIPLTLAVFRRVLQVRPSLTLLLVGNRGPETQLIQRLIQDKRLRGRVFLVNDVKEEQLQWCYRNCKLLLATSAIEGFGLPVAEAILVGCPVVCSDIPALREIGENYCDFVRLDSSAEKLFADAIERVVDRRRPHPALLPQLSTTSIALAYMELYQDVLSKQQERTASAPRFHQQKRGTA